MITPIALRFVAAAFAGLVVLPAAGAAPGEPLSEDELGQLFGVFDGDGSGAIAKPEFRGVIASFRAEFVDAEIDKMFDTYDLDKDELLQRPEFGGLMNGFAGGEEDLPQQMERAFLRFDANRDGGLDAQEVKALMEASGKPMSLREAKTIVFEADEDGNGRIDADEFNKVSG